jgi:hypothetical protein
MGFLQNLTSNHNTTRRGFLRSALAASLALYSCKRKKTRPKLAPLPSMALAILQNARLSSRYQDFTNTVASLIKKGKIKFKESNTLEKYQSYAIYNSKTNTVEIDESWDSADKKHFQATIIHELFHAYQDYQKRYIKNSVREAEALIAEYDYRYHKNEYIPPVWLVIRRLPGEKNNPGLVFNIPHSIIKSCANKGFASTNYKRTVARVAQTKLRAKYYGFQRLLSEPLIDDLEKTGKSLDEINRLWEKLRMELAAIPPNAQRTALINESIRTIGKEPLPNQIMISTFIALSQLLTQKYLAAKKVDDAQTVYNQTFKTLWLFIWPADLSPFDVAYKFDGIN